MRLCARGGGDERGLVGMIDFCSSKYEFACQSQSKEIKKDQGHKIVKRVISVEIFELLK